MEVHHHSHSHGKKTWKSYIWEFIMLFLAVFCGSLAEYWLEHKIEKDREKQYITSLVADLKIDTSNINATFADFKKTEPYFDTINAGILKFSKKYDAKTDFALKRVVGYKDFVATDKTLQQLKNSGTLRLIQKSNVTDAIASYDLFLKKFNITNDELQKQFHRMFECWQSLIYHFKDSTNSNYLISNNESDFKKYHNNINMTRKLKQIYLVRLQELNVANITLLALIKKEYNIE